MSFHCDICDLCLGIVLFVQLVGIAIHSNQGHVLLVKIDLFG